VFIRVDISHKLVLSIQVELFRLQHHLRTRHELRISDTDVPETVLLGKLFEDVFHEQICLLEVEGIRKLRVQEKDNGPFVANMFSELGGDQGVSATFVRDFLFWLSISEQLHVLECSQPTPVEADLHADHQTHLVFSQGVTMITLRMRFKSFKIRLVLVQLFGLELLEAISDNFLIWTTEIFGR